MQLYSHSAEMRALVTVTSRKLGEDVRTLWLGKLHKDLFHNPVARSAFERIDRLAKKRFKIVSFKSLLEDPSLDEDIRDALAQVREKPCAKKSIMVETLATLEEFRKIRVVAHAVEQVVEKLEGSSVDTEAMLMDLTTAVAKANASKQEDEFFLHFGAQSNNDDIVDAICRNETSPRISTGYTQYDTSNGGFPESGVVIIAATTSGGKSTIAMNICRHMYLVNNYSTFRVTLEMQALQETQRLMSHLTGVPLARFSQAKLTAEDKEKVRKAKTKMDKHGKKHGINYTTLSPKANLSMDDCLRMAKPFGYKIIVIDYIGLLAEEDGADQWKSLMNAARTAKNYTRETGTLVILLAQLDDEKEKLRYSKGMKEHADVLWQWNYSKPEQRELGILSVDVAKDRDAKIMSFELTERFDIMTAFNPDEMQPGSRGGGDIEFEDDEEQKPKDTKKLKGKKGDKKTKGSKTKSIESDLRIKGKKKKGKKPKLLGFDDGEPALA